MLPIMFHWGFQNFLPMNCSCMQFDSTKAQTELFTFNWFIKLISDPLHCPHHQVAARHAVKHPALNPAWRRTSAVPNTTSKVTAYQTRKIFCNLISKFAREFTQKCLQHRPSCPGGKPTIRSHQSPVRLLSKRPPPVYQDHLCLEKRKQKPKCEFADFFYLFWSLITNQKTFIISVKSDLMLKIYY